jgi:CTP:molybdopterin cytidylyltransferase MocA
VDVPAPGPAVWPLLAAVSGIAIPTHARRRGHPAALPAPWIQTVLRPALQRRTPERLDRLIAEAREVPVDDPAVATNLNTPEDLHAWLNAESE